MKTFFTILQSSFLVAFLTLGASCGVQKEGIVIAQNADATNLDPHKSNNSPTSMINSVIFNKLIRTDNNMNFVGDLAVEWKPIEDTVWEFQLREGVKWHDGEEFTADDVAFSIMRQKEAARVGHLVSPVVEVNVIDRYTVHIVTDIPFGPLLSNLAHSGSKIVPKHLVEGNDEGFSQILIGTGPFQFKEWNIGDSVVLERFDDYFEGPAPAEKLIFRNIPEGTNRTIALETGEVDLVILPEPVDKKRIEENPELKLYERLSNRVEYLSFNTTKEPVDNPLVRRALYHAIDKSAILQIAADNRGEIANTVIGKKVLGYNPNVPVLDHNRELSKQLLAEAGYATGLNLTIWASGDVRDRIAQVIQANFREVGVTSQIELLEWGAYLDRTANGEHQAFLLGWTNLTADGDGGMMPLFHSSRFGRGGNRAFYSNPEVDRLLERGREGIDPSLRAEEYREAQLIIMEELPWVPLFYQTVDLAARADLKGVDLHPGSMHRFLNLHY